MSKVEYKHLRELCTVNQGLQIPIESRFKENGPNRYFYITVQFLKESHVEKYYVENPPPSSICKVDDIIVVRTGSTGQVLTGVTGCFHNNFFRVNYDRSLLNHKYLYYCLSTKEKQKEMLVRSGLTTIPDLNHFMFLDIKIPTPELKTQQKIASVLSALDDKIELNNKINAELEAMSKTLYDYWFVQFDFPNADGKPYKSSGGEMFYDEVLKRGIPKGWAPGNLSDLGEITGGSTPPRGIPDYFTKRGTAWITPKDLSQNKSNKFIAHGELDVSERGIKSASLRVMPKGTILLSTRAPVGYLAISKDFVTTNQGFKSFVPSKGYSTEFIYYAVKNLIPAIENNAVGSTFKEISASTLKGIALCLPDKDVIADYDKFMSSVFKRQELLEQQNKELATLRDWLLPMLMNGQVTVEGSCKEIEEKLGMVAEGKTEYKIKSNDV